MRRVVPSGTEKLLAKKILIVGRGGAGKSTFSKSLGEMLGLPVIHLDSFFWKPNWRESSKDEWRRTVEELIRCEAWVMDGNYGGTMDMRLAACDAAIFLDMPRILCLRRVISRRIRFAGKSRPDMAPGCHERVEWQFLKYIWDYPKTRRPGILEKLEALPEEKPTFVLRSPEEAREFLESVGREVSRRS